MSWPVRTGTIRRHAPRGRRCHNFAACRSIECGDVASQDRAVVWRSGLFDAAGPGGTPGQAEGGRT